MRNRSTRREHHRVHDDRARAVVQGLAVEAQAGVGAQAGDRLPVVLREPREVIRIAIHLGVQRHAAASRVAEEQVGERVAAVGARERVRPRRVAVVQRLDADDAVVATELHVVRAHQLAQRGVRAVLVVAVGLAIGEPRALVASHRQRREAVGIREAVGERRVVPQRLGVELVRQVVVVVELVVAILTGLVITATGVDETTELTVLVTEVVEVEVVLTLCAAKAAA